MRGPSCIPPKYDVIWLYTKGLSIRHSNFVTHLFGRLQGIDTRFCDEDITDIFRRAIEPRSPCQHGCLAESSLCYRAIPTRNVSESSSAHPYKTTVPEPAFRKP